jgi:hypothetical protein
MGREDVQDISFLYLSFLRDAGMSSSDDDDDDESSMRTFAKRFMGREDGYEILALGVFDDDDGADLVVTEQLTISSGLTTLSLIGTVVH